MRKTDEGRACLRVQTRSRLPLSATSSFCAWVLRPKTSSVVRHASLPVGRDQRAHVGEWVDVAGCRTVTFGR
jgi:hypothetical protein